MGPREDSREATRQALNGRRAPRSRSHQTQYVNAELEMEMQWKAFGKGLERAWKVLGKKRSQNQTAGLTHAVLPYHSRTRP